MPAEDPNPDRSERERQIAAAELSLQTAGYQAFPRVGHDGEQYALEVPFPSLPELSVVLRCDRWEGRWVFRQTGCRPVADANDLEALLAWVKRLVEPPFGESL
ncbi:hypothetical protein [Actinopolymorpha alba]|uniref:hypothetical protein n=1 Tax=Actinopolymorpha alba TaxID=533267 RepID=UPI000377E47A|nr:hypothetical protein [Actinopolymorpha alba]